MTNEPPTGNLRALVLCGGQSSRMGRDKGSIDYHGMPHGQWLYQLLETLGLETYLSVRSGQSESWMEGLRRIDDRDKFRGPFNGLLSAHVSFPNSAWLVVACDLPLIDAENLERLLQQRDKKAVATAFATRSSGLPEPLVALWEDHGLSRAITYLEEAESSCPRKFLIRHQAKTVHPSSDEVLLNANRPEDLDAVHQHLSS